MTVHTTIVYKWNDHTLATESRTFRGRWLADAERKAMQYAQGSPMFRFASNIRILCEQPCGKTSSLCWLMGHTPAELPENLHQYA